MSKEEHSADKFPPPPPEGVPGMPSPEDVHHVVRSFFGVLAAHTLGAAVRLGIIDTIGDGEMTSDEVASACDTHPEATKRLLRAMAGLVLLEETEAGAFRVAPAGTLLYSGRPGSMASVVRLFTDPLTVRSWEDLTASVRTGEAAFPKHFGKSYFEYLEGDPQRAKEFNASMSEASHAAAEMLPHHFDFSAFGTVVDVGGGDGTLLASILRQNPELKGVLFDTSNGLAQAEEALGRSNVADRCTVTDGDFFSEVPRGGRLYILKAVLHDWDDERCLTILRNVREAVPDDGRLLVIEGVLPPRVDPQLRGAYLSDLNMLVNHGGKERTAEDFRVLFEKAGFDAPSISPLPLPGEIALIESAPTRS